MSFLTAASVDPQRIFTDKLSGSATTARPGLAALLDYARPGDTLVVAEITRTIADLGEHRIMLRALREGVDTATSGGACGGSDHGHVGRAGTRTGA